MKIAYLVAAHTDPQHLLRLVQALQPQAEFFVHVDAKADMQAFQAQSFPPRVHFLTHRTRISWGTYSQVVYQQALLKAYFDSGIACDRLFLLSGMDYPLWSNQDIDRFFEQHPHREFIQGINMVPQNKAVKQNYCLYNPVPFLNLNNSLWEAKVRKGLRLFIKSLGVRRSLTIPVGNQLYHLYKGSSWWCITPKLAAYMLTILESKPEIKWYFRHSFCPDECIWQTLVFNSPFREQALLTNGEYTSLTALTPLHYINYNPTIKVLVKEDFNTLIESGKMFCRKTCTGTSDELLDCIDHYRARQEKTELQTK